MPEDLAHQEDNQIGTDPFLELERIASVYRRFGNDEKAREIALLLIKLRAKEPALAPDQQAASAT